MQAGNEVITGNARQNNPVQEALFVNDFAIEVDELAQDTYDATYGQGTYQEPYHITRENYWNAISYLRTNLGVRVDLTGRSWPQNCQNLLLFMVREYNLENANIQALNNIQNNYNIFSNLIAHIRWGENDYTYLLHKRDLYIIGFYKLVNNHLYIFVTDDALPKGNILVIKRRAAEIRLGIISSIPDNVWNNNQGQTIKLEVARNAVQLINQQTDNDLAPYRIQSYANSSVHMIHLNHTGGYGPLGGSFDRSETFKSGYGININNMDIQDFSNYSQMIKDELGMAARCISEAIRFSCIQQYVCQNERSAILNPQITLQDLVENWSATCRSMHRHTEAELRTGEDNNGNILCMKRKALHIIGMLIRD